VLGRAFLLVAVGLTGALVVFGTLTASPPLTDTDALGQIVTFVLLLSLAGVFLDRFGIVLREALEKANRSREELQAKVAERTAELAAKNQELEKLARIKEEFVSNVSHELRTPITNLKLYQGLLAAHPDEIDEHLAVLRRETDRLNHIIEDLLRLSRIDQGRIELNLTTLDVNALTGQYVADRQPLAEAKGLALAFAGQPDLPLVRGDEGLLGQALSILLTNALSYTPEGGEVTVSTQRKPLPQKQWVGFSVSDNGPGVTLEEQSQLFQRFFRGNAGRASNTPGTGLGLAIVKEIVQRHQGRIDVVSEGVPGKGATFSVWLPATERAT
jgi:signal transduction histidine kinase